MGVPIASTPATTTSNSCVRLSSQHGAFYAAGRYWVFYIDATLGDIYYKTSTDGENWSSANLIGSVIGSGAGYDVVFDGTYVHYVRNTHDTYYPPHYAGLVYRRGTPQSDGSINWSAAEQTVYNQYNIVGDVQLSVDSGGYPWVGYAYTANRYPYVTKSSTNDGTWSTASGFPHTFFATSRWYVIPVPQTSGKVYCIVYRTATSEQKILGYAWDGDSWGSQEIATTSDLSNIAGDGTPGMLSAVAVGDDIHLAFMASNEDIKYVKRTSGSWGSESTIEATTCANLSSPVLTKRENNNLICYWLHSDDKAYFKQCISGAWDTNPTELIDEGTDDFYSERLIQAYYEEISGHVVLVYQTKTSSPYNIRHVIGGVVAGVEYQRSGTASLGLVGTGTRPVGCVRSDTGLLGLLATATRSWALTRSETALLGLKATASRIITPIRAQTALLGLKATASEAVDYAAKTGTALLGLLATGSRTMVLSRSKMALLGLKATGVMSTLGHYTKEAVVYLGLAVTGTRSIVLARVDTALLGLKATATKAITLTRVGTALLGLKAVGILIIPYIRTATAYLGLKATASRSFALTRLNTALLGLKAVATRSLVLSRAKTALLGLKVIGSLGAPGRALKLIIVTTQKRQVNVITSLYRKIRIFTE